MRLAVLALCLASALAVPRNFTIDDASGDEQSGAKPVFNPSSFWVARTSMSDCSTCQTNPEPDLTHGRSWHDSTIYPDSRWPNETTVSFSFTGTAIYVYAILAGDLPNDAVTGTHAVLRVDGQDRANFDWSPADTKPTPPDYQYDQLILQYTGLENKEHSVVVACQIGNIRGLQVASVLLFDYVLYTTEVEETSTTGSGTGTGTSTHSPGSSETAAPSSSGRSSNAMPIGLGVGLGLFVATCLALLAYIVLFRRRRRRDANDQFFEPSVYQVPSSAQVTYGSPSSGNGGAPASFDAWSSVSPIPTEAAIFSPYRGDSSVLPTPSSERKGSTVATSEIERLRRENDELRTRAQAPPQYSG